MNERQEHPLRHRLHGEVHARPFVAMRAPESITHIAMLTGEGTQYDDLSHLARLCERFGIQAPESGNYFHGDFGPFRLKWERHTEFCTYSFHMNEPLEVPFEQPTVGRVPTEWLARLPGQCLVAIHIAILPAGKSAPDKDEIAAILGTRDVIGSTVSGGATVWTDFHIHADGYSRILVHDANLPAFQLGRLVQRLLEIETYRMMALLGLPLARDTAPDLTKIDRKLSDVIATLSRPQSVDQNRTLLHRLMGLAAEMESTSARTEYRFGATRAYYALVLDRIKELREHRIEGVQTIAEFMERRLKPAYMTCESAAERQSKLSRRITRAGNLLRAGVDISLEEQNNALLASMDRRASQQLRLQQTVEGLSVAAISYYLVSLLDHILLAVREAGVDFNVTVAKGVSIPLILLLVWLAIRALRMSLLRSAKTSKPTG